MIRICWISAGGTGPRRNVARTLTCGLPVASCPCEKVVGSVPAIVVTTSSSTCFWSLSFVRVCLSFNLSSCCRNQDVLPACTSRLPPEMLGIFGGANLPLNLNTIATSFEPVRMPATANTVRTDWKKKVRCPLFPIPSPFWQAKKKDIAGNLAGSVTTSRKTSSWKSCTQAISVSARPLDSRLTTDACTSHPAGTPLPSARQRNKTTTDTCCQRAATPNLPPQNEETKNDFKASATWMNNTAR